MAYGSNLEAGPNPGAPGWLSGLIGIGRAAASAAVRVIGQRGALGSVRWPPATGDRYPAGGGGGSSGTRTPAIGIGGNGPRTGGATARS